MMNDTITLADWHTFHQLDSGIYGYMAGDATRPENPALTMATPRIVTLNPGQVIFVGVTRGCRSLQLALGGRPSEAPKPFAQVGGRRHRRSRASRQQRRAVVEQ